MLLLANDVRLTMSGLVSLSGSASQPFGLSPARKGRGLGRFSAFGGRLQNPARILCSNISLWG